MQTGKWWRYGLTEQEKERLNKSTRTEGDHQAIHINLLELIGMVFTAALILLSDDMNAPAGGGTVLLRGDNTAAVSWLTTGRAPKDPRSGWCCRMLGTVEVLSEARERHRQYHR